MAERITLSRRTVPPGSYQHDIVAPARANAAKLTMTRAPSGWPEGTLFTYRVYERDRGRGAEGITLLASGTESGGPAIGKDGTTNPPFAVTLTWPSDKDRDLIRIELDVVQAFQTAFTLEFL